MIHIHSTANVLSIYSFLQRGNLTYLLCGENGLCDSLDQVHPDYIIASAVICIVIFYIANSANIYEELPFLSPFSTRRICSREQTKK